MADPLLPTTEKPPKKSVRDEEIIVLLESQYPLFDPELNIRFQPGVQTPVPRISTWLQDQLDADLFIKV